MARRPGAKNLPFNEIEKQLGKQRRERHDVYATLGQVQVEIGDSLAPPEKRYRMNLPGTGRPKPHFLTPHAMRQLCTMAGVPQPFMERVPPSLGLKVLRCLIRTCEKADGRELLFRTRGIRNPKVRAVLPQSHVRFDDDEVLAEVRDALGEADVQFGCLTVDEDSFHLRLLHGDTINLGTSQHEDAALPGIDIISSETGRHRLEVRNVLYRMICENGITEIASAQQALKTRYTSLDRKALRQTLGGALRESVSKASELASTLAESRATYVKDVKGELESIFRKHRLGSPRGRIGQWVAEQVAKHIDMFGVQRFEIIQAFTAVARGLDHRERMKLEDAMGAYLTEPLERN